MVLSVLLAAILDFLRDSLPGLRTWNSPKQKFYFELESQVCVSNVHPDVMYNHDNWDFICSLGGHFVLQFWKGKTENRAWHGADLESAYPICVKTTTLQILLRNAFQTFRMPLFEKWALTMSENYTFFETQWPWPPLFSPSWLIQWSMGEGVLYSRVFTEWRHCVSQNQVWGRGCNITLFSPSDVPAFHRYCF